MLFLSSDPLQGFKIEAQHNAFLPGKVSEADERWKQIPHGELMTRV
jgi:hypothetical protein